MSSSKKTNKKTGSKTSKKSNSNKTQERFIGIYNHTELRKQLLSCAKDSLIILKTYETEKIKLKEYSEYLKQIKENLDELNQYLNNIVKSLPELQETQEKIESKTQTKKTVSSIKEQTGLSNIEIQLQRIEDLLNDLK